MPFSAFAAGAAETANVLKEAANRVVDLPEVLGTLAGARRPKRLRLRVAILRDEEGRPVASEGDAGAAVVEAKRVLWTQARVKLLAAGERWVETLADAAPRAALDVPCAEGWWRADLGHGGAYFRRHGARTLRGTLTGSGAPLTAFVVRDVLGRAGCSLGPLVDYVTVDPRALHGATKRVLAHELGHACGLPHSREADNLMLPTRMGDRLEVWQIAVLRSSRHVTYS
jgi:hypothetical protein